MNRNNSGDLIPTMIYLEDQLNIWLYKSTSGKIILLSGLNITQVSLVKKIIQKHIISMLKLNVTCEAFEARELLKSCFTDGVESPLSSRRGLFKI